MEENQNNNTETKSSEAPQRPQASTSESRPESRPASDTRTDSRPSGDNRSDNRPRGNNRGGRKFVFRKKFCWFTKNKINYIDYKDVDLLRRYVNNAGKILPRRFTGTSARYQRMLARAIKRARAIALLPYVGD